MYKSVGRLGARKVRVSFMYRWADRATHKMGLRDQGVMGRGHEEVPPWSRHRKLVVWAWSLKKGGPSRLFKGWLCGLGDEDKYSPLKTLDDFTTAVTILEIMINGPCLSFTAEIFFYKWWRHTLYIIQKEWVQFFWPQQKEPQTFVIFYHPVSVSAQLQCWESSNSCFPQKRLILKSKSINRLKVGTMQSWNNFKYWSALSCFEANNWLFQPW